MGSDTIGKRQFHLLPKEDLKREKEKEKKLIPNALYFLIQPLNSSRYWEPNQTAG